ncbi:hypothetical protein AMECASPLE_033043 [Ameca splendens]|uniref:Uncharacterized protein n=1 Tax=Ameca splendens TaxID=208324 RepID=A0ABV0ZT37_9TELE
MPFLLSLLYISCPHLLEFSIKINYSCLDASSLFSWPVLLLSSSCQWKSFDSLLNIVSLCPSASASICIWVLLQTHHDSRMCVNICATSLVQTVACRKDKSDSG